MSGIDAKLKTEQITEEQAKKETASHIQKFWGRDMRNQIKEHVSDTSEKNSQLNPFVFNAISKYLKD